MRKYFLIILTILLFGNCKTEEEKFIDQIVAAFKENSLYKNKIRWDHFREEVEGAAEISKYLAIEKALTLNKNPHSFYLMDKQKIRGKYPMDYDLDYCVYEKKDLQFALGNDIAYLRIPSLVIEPGQEENYKDLKIGEYLWFVKDEIMKKDGRDLKGWVIDLRFNEGGNMWPMLMALAPFFEDGNLGYFVSLNEETEWKVKGGRVYSDGHDFNELFDISPYPRPLQNKDKPIVVLISHQTSSAGEAVAISLMAHSNVCFLGDDTAGYATGNKIIPIEEKEYLVLTNTVMADHTHLQYWDGVKADLQVCEERELIGYAKRWLTEQIL